MVKLEASNRKTAGKTLKYLEIKPILLYNKGEISETFVRK